MRSTFEMTSQFPRRATRRLRPPSLILFALGLMNDPLGQRPSRQWPFSRESDRGVTDERNKNMKRILIGLALVGLAGSGLEQEMKVVKVEDLVWTEHPVF